MAKLIKIDRNGSKHYQGMVECDRCGGTGIYAYCICNGQIVPNWTDNGVCHKCLGAGQVFSKWIERTPEYQAKLDAKRQAKHEAEQKKHDVELQTIRTEWLKKNGWTEDGKTFVFLGDTYSNKDEIKSLGAKFTDVIGWHIDHKVDGFQFMELTKEQFLEEAYWGYRISATLLPKDIKEMKKDAERQQNPSIKASEYQGKIGDILDLKVVLIHSVSWEQKSIHGWGNETMFCHIFKDADGNIFTWKTMNALIISTEGNHDWMLMKGTVKGHSEYKGEKQTVLTRCKIKGFA